jgi:hypothetical protein
MHEIEVFELSREKLVFRFPVPLSLELLVVSNEEETVFWEIIAETYEPVEVLESSFHSWPSGEAPEGFGQILPEVEGLNRERLASGPSQLPLLAEVIFGSLPPGYREETQAKALLPGEYCVLVMSEEGQAAARFQVPHR